MPSTTLRVLRKQGQKLDHEACYGLKDLSAHSEFFTVSKVRESAEKDDWVPKMEIVQCSDSVNWVVF